jgi:hypothetical protein
VSGTQFAKSDITWWGRMKRFAIVLSIIPVLAFVTTATATATITGKYRTTITTPASAAGTWTLNFKKNGTGTMTWNGQLTPLGFTFKGSTFTSPGGAGYVCPTVGTYRIHLAGKHLTLTAIRDTCKIGRAQVFPRHIWTKVG